MLTYDALLHAPLDRLKAAADHWLTCAERLDSLTPDIRQQIVRPVTAAGWSGADAAAGIAYMDKVVKEVGDAARAARGVHRILDDAYTRMKEAQDELLRIRDVEAPADGLVVRPDGTPEVRAPAGGGQSAHARNAGHGDGGAGDLTAACRRKIPALAHRIGTAVERADVADEEAARALRADTDGNPYDFRGPRWTGLDAAQADRAAGLAARGELMTDGELQELDRILDVNGTDQPFATAFATRLGPRGTLSFWLAMANPTRSLTDAHRLTALTALQRHLGTTLATATHSTGAAMRTWERQLLCQASLRIPAHRPVDPAAGPYGFQIMSALMRHGTYGTAFLEAYGSSLVAFERHSGHSPEDLWLGDPDALSTVLTFGNAPDDRGHDPMTGLMEALGHNPAAATAFFHDPATFAYLTGPNSDGSPHRAWPLDTSSYTDTPGSHPAAGFDSLGHALEAATTGAPYDTAHPALHRTAATAAIAQEVITKYGNDPALLHTQPGIADSIGRVGAAYIDDLDNAIDPHTPGTDPFPASGRSFRVFGDPVLGQQQAMNFLSIIGQDRTAHGIVSAAQHTYTASLLLGNPPDGHTHYANAQAALTTEAKVRGILDSSRAGQARAEYGASADAMNQELSRSTDYIKIGTGTLVGIGVGLIPVPGASAVGAAVVPVATETAGEALSTFLEHRIDDVAASHEADATQQIYDAGKRFFTTGWNDVYHSYLAYARMHGDPLYASDAEMVRLLNEAQAAYYATGPGMHNYRGQPPYEGN
jgi:hypothetical protein